MGLHCWTSNIAIVFFVFVFANLACAITVMAIMAMIIVLVER